MWRAIMAVLFVVAVVAACHEADVYVYSARRWDPELRCLSPYEPVDQMNGSSVSSRCAPNCFRFNDQTYTSHVCPPLPLEAVELDAAAPECKAAVAAYGRTCGADAGEAADGGDAAAAQAPDADVLDAGDGGG